MHLVSLTSLTAVLRGRDQHGIAEIEAGIPRSLGHAIVRDPTEDDASHTLICPPRDVSQKQRKRDARQMASAARLIVSTFDPGISPP